MMLKIGVVGLGNIAQKAYLPVMAQMQDQVEWILCTRDEQKLAHLQHQFGFSESTRSVPELIAQHPDAVFIHTPTHTHTELIRTFLNAGIHVYVDKPVSENYEEVSELYQLAAQRQLLLTAGFNRRFAPFQQQIATSGQPAVIIVQKNRIRAEQAVGFAIYDLFIHVVDTALYLAGIDARDQVSCQYQLSSDQGILQNCGLVLSSKNLTVYALMNMQAGANTETSEVQQISGTKRLENLEHLTISTENGTQVNNFPDWTPTLTRRGFEPLIHEFVSAVATNATNPVSPATSMLSHQLCSELVDFYHQQK
ncbi:Gfo/Idh/MocA family protein [Lapidilactobacillus mulanensis]|nr:Gfo/Idh/MocA family oxidoreductase [Lapidilactobacillus mulanensis]